MDILDCSTEEKSRTGVKMPLKKPGTDEILSHEMEGYDEPREMFLTLLGLDAGDTQRALEKIRARADRKKDGFAHTSSDEELERERVADSKIFASLTVDGLVFMGGEWIKVDAKNAYSIYYRVRAFRNQALSFMLNESNFTKG